MTQQEFKSFKLGERPNINTVFVSKKRMPRKFYKTWTSELDFAYCEVRDAKKSGEDPDRFTLEFAEQIRTFMAL